MCIGNKWVNIPAIRNIPIHLQNLSRGGAKVFNMICELIISCP